MRIWCSGLLAVLCVLAVAAADERRLEVQLGETKISLVRPLGYTDGCGAREDVRRLFESSQPATNALHACFIADGEFARWDELGPEDDAPILILTSVRQLDARTTSGADFAAIAQVFEQQQAQLFEAAERQSGEILDRAAEEASTQAGSEVGFGEFGIVPAGVFSKTEKTFGFAVLRTVSVESEEGTVATRQAVASMLVHLQGKVLVITVEKEFEREADLDEVIALAKSWTALQPL